MDEKLEINPGLLKAMEIQRQQAARQVKEAELNSKVPKIVSYLAKLAVASSLPSKKDLIQKINKECTKYLKEEASW